MVQTKLIKLIGLVFFVCCNSYAQTAPPLQNPNTMVIGPYPNADGYFPIGLEGDHGNNKLDKKLQ